MAEVSLWRNGAPVQLAPGASAALEFILPEAVSSRFQAGDSIPAWRRSVRNAGFRSRQLRAAAGSPLLVWIRIQPHRSVGELRAAGASPPG
jgi:hypothetical protein